MRLVLLVVVLFGLSGCQSMAYVAASGLQGFAKGTQEIGSNSDTYHCEHDIGTDYTCHK